MEPLQYPSEENGHVTEFSLTLIITQVHNKWSLSSLLVPHSLTSDISNQGCMLLSLFLRLVLLPETVLPLSLPLLTLSDLTQLTTPPRSFLNPSLTFTNLAPEHQLHLPCSPTAPCAFFHNHSFNQLQTECPFLASGLMLEQREGSLRPSRSHSSDAAEIACQ